MTAAAPAGISPLYGRLPVLMLASEDGGQGEKATAASLDSTTEKAAPTTLPRTHHGRTGNAGISIRHTPEPVGEASTKAHYTPPTGRSLR